MALWVTSHGIGISTDSTRYITIANNLIAGRGFSTNGLPITHYPPVYPIILAIVSYLGNNPLESIRWLHAILFGINISLFALTVYLCTDHNLVATALAYFIFLSSEAVLRIHMYVWSESPFLTTLLLGFLLLSFYLTSPRYSLLLSAAVLFGLSIGIRYAGLAVIPTLLIALLVFSKQPLRRRIIDAIITVVISLSVMAVWLARNRPVSQTATGRIFSVHPVNANHLKSLISTLNDFFLPLPTPPWLKASLPLVILAALAWAFWILFKLRPIKARPGFIGLIYSYLALLFSIFYLAVILITISFLDASTPIDYRILSPIFLFSAIAAITLTVYVSNALQKPSIWRIFIDCILILIGINIVFTVYTALDFRENGIEYNSRSWNESQTLSRLENLKLDGKVYSNLAEVVQFKTGIDTIDIPHKIDAGTLIQNSYYPEQLLAMCQEIKAGTALVVYMKGISFRQDLPDQAELQATCQLPILDQFEDGIIFGVK